MKKEILKIGLIFVVTVAAVVFGLNYLYGGKASQSSKASGESITMSVDPTSVTTTTANQDFTVTLKIKPSVDVVLRGYSVSFPYDKDKITLKSIDYKLGVVAADIGDTTAGVAAANQRGRVKIVGESQAATGMTAAASATTDLAVLTFTSPAATAGATISITDPMTSFFAIRNDATLFNVPLAAAVSLPINGGGPTPSTNPTGTSGNGKLNLKLKFQGIASKPADTYNKLTVRVKLLNDTTNVTTDYKTADFTADANGVWTGNVNFDVVSTSKYVVYVKGPYHIQKKVCDQTPTETSPGTYRCDKGNITLNSGDNNLDFTGIVLLAGDLPVQDGSVTAYDTSLVRNNLGKTDADSLSKCDVNRDGKVDTQDYSLIIAALSVRGDE